jgi:hypothetical protein
VVSSVDVENTYIFYGFFGQPKIRKLSAVFSVGPSEKLMFGGFFRWAVGKAYVRRFFPLGRRKSLCSVIFPYWAAKTYWVAEDN